jgi:hypothetical protein
MTGCSIPSSTEEPPRSRPGLHTVALGLCTVVFSKLPTVDRVQSYPTLYVGGAYSKSLRPRITKNMAYVEQMYEYQQAWGMPVPQCFISDLEKC